MTPVTVRDPKPDRARGHIKVGLFDSGVGGLTVLHYLQNVFPAEYIYITDTKNFPYGGKSPEQLLTICQENIERLLADNVDIIIFACHTMSANCIEQMRSKYQIPLISVTELLIQEALDSQAKNVLVLATQATVATHIFSKKLSSHGIQVFEQACPGLADVIERGEPREVIEKMVRGFLNVGTDQSPVRRPSIQRSASLGVSGIGIASGEVTKRILDRDEQNNSALVLSDFERSEKLYRSIRPPEIEFIILGCTHYEAIKDIIKELLPEVHIISLQDAVAKLTFSK